MTETGIETTDGLREFDIIVWATGFDFGTGALSRMGIRRPRRPRARTSTGPTVPRPSSACRPAGFPNLFFPGGPHAAAGNNPRYNGDQVDFVTEVLVHAPRPRLRRRRGVRDVRGALDPHGRQGRRPAPRSARIGQYVGGNIPGKPKRYLLNTGGRFKLFEIIADVRAAPTSTPSRCRRADRSG